MENQDIQTNLEENNINAEIKQKKVKEPKPIKEKKIKIKSESRHLFLISLLTMIGGSLVLASAVYIGIVFISPKKLAAFVANSFGGELKDNFSFNFIHYWSFVIGFAGCGLIFVYSLIIFYHIYINKVIKRYMWGATLVVSAISILIAISYIILLSFVLGEIKGVTFAKDGDRFTFKPASWIAKVIGTKYVDAQDAKMTYDNYVLVIQLINSFIGIVLFGVTLFSFITTKIIVSPDAIKQKKLKSFELRDQRKEKRKEKRALKIAQKSEAAQTHGDEVSIKHRRHKKNFLSKKEKNDSIDSKQDSELIDKPIKEIVESKDSEPQPIEKQKKLKSSKKSKKESEEQ